MSDQYPKMLFRPGEAGADNAVVIEGLSFETRVVADPDEEETASDDGWARYDERDTTATPLPEANGSAADKVEDHAAVAELLRDELIAADEKLKAMVEQIAEGEQALASASSTISTLRTEVTLANDRIAHLEAENARLTEKLAALDNDGDGTPGGSLKAEPPALSGKTKAELLAIAEAEGVTIEDGALNADIIAAIELKREAGAA